MKEKLLFGMVLVGCAAPNQSIESRDSALETTTLSPVVMFGRGFLSQSKVEAIVNAAGDTLVSWDYCEDDAGAMQDQCVIISVAGEDLGNGFTSLETRGISSSTCTGGTACYGSYTVEVLTVASPTAVDGATGLIESEIYERTTHTTGGRQRLDQQGYSQLYFSVFGGGYSYEYVYQLFDMDGSLVDSSSLLAIAAGGSAELTCADMATNVANTFEIMMHSVGAAAVDTCHANVEAGQFDRSFGSWSEAKEWQCSAEGKGHTAAMRDMALTIQQDLIDTNCTALADSAWLTAGPDPETYDVPTAQCSELAGVAAGSATSDTVQSGNLDCVWVTTYEYTGSDGNTNGSCDVRVSDIEEVCTVAYEIGEACIGDGCPP